MPIFPIVDSVPDTQLILYSLEHHLHVEVKGQLDEIVVITAIEEPLYATEGVQGGVIGFVHIIESGVLTDRLAEGR